MALIVKGVFDLTCSIFNAVAYVIVRDFTNYYWYLEEAEQQYYAEIERLTSNDESYNCLNSREENERPEIMSDTECVDENVPIESFCTSLNIGDETTEDLNSLSIEENTISQNYEIKLNNLELPHTESSDDKLDKLDEIQKNEDIYTEQNFIGNLNSSKPFEKELFHDMPDDMDEGLGRPIGENVIQGNEDCLKSFELCKEESPSYTTDVLNEIQCDENNALVWNDEENFNLLKSKIENQIWEEIENVHNTFSDDQNISEVDHPETSLDEKWMGIFSTEMEFKFEFDSKISIVESTETEDTFKNVDETIEFVGYGKTSEFASLNDKKSDTSEVELGITYFPLKKLQNETPITEKPGAFNENKDIVKKKSRKSKIHRYTGKNSKPKIKQTEELEYSDKTSTESSIKTQEETEPVRLLPLTTYEIASTKSLLTESQEFKTSNENVDLAKFDEILDDDLSGISKVPDEISEIGSACSDDSWDSWFSRFATIVRSKSPMKDPEGFTESVAEDVCDCINTHCCLQVVDSDEGLNVELLSANQLGSVETGSAGKAPL